MTAEAGRGEHHIYKIVPQNDSDSVKWTAGNHYVGIEAVAWFVNKQDSWLSNNIASGTLDIKLSGGLEHYSAALGAFHPSDGARIAPVFGKPILSDRNYRGGPMSFSAICCAVKKDPVIESMLKSASIASLGITAGMVETASLTGPATILAAASQYVIINVREVLTDASLKCETIFDFSRSEYSLQPEDLVGPQIFILFHRGADLNESRLSVRPGIDLPGKRQRGLLMPYYENNPLEDGAWLLLRIIRSDEYSGARNWLTDVGKFRSRVRGLVDDVVADSINKDDGLAQLKPSGTGNKTILDEFFRLRSIIYSDGVLSEREAGIQVGLLYTTILAATSAIKKHNSQILTTTVDEVIEALSRGQGIEGEIGQAFAEQVASVASFRKPYLVKDAGSNHVAKLNGDELFSTMQYLPNTLKRATL